MVKGTKLTKQKLLIVESPTKARTIKQYLGASFPVISSMGHVRDLPKSKMGIDIANGYEPEYVAVADKSKTVDQIKRMAKKTGGVVMATDPDREGEAIAWHIANVLELSTKGVERVTFHEITKSAIEEALAKPRKIDFNLVDAQQARRVLDRLVGYELSPFLWKKIRYGLSAGRVQSVAVRLVVEREREREAFDIKKFWKLSAFAGKDKTAKMETRIVPELDKTDETEAEEVAEKALSDYVKNPDLWRFYVIDEGGKSALDKDKVWVEKMLATLPRDISIEKVTESESSVNPPPPFTTSTLQRAVFSRLGYSAKKTMMIAQRLYEAGAITYMRTDSVALSSQAIDAARSYIDGSLGKEFLPDSPRFYRKTQKLAQEAHEAIRPTVIDKKMLEGGKWTSDQQKVYGLIWRRTVACQCNPARVKKWKVEGMAGKLKVEGSTSEVLFDGFYKVAGTPVTLSANKSFTPKEGESLNVSLWAGVEGHTPPPPRYTDASLIKALEEYGIGRPSTYASIIDTVISRGYVAREARALAPTDSGFVVNDLLVKHFDQIVNYEFTAEMENELDEIAEGKRKWKKVVDDFYKPFKKNLSEKDKTVDKNDVVVLGKSDEKCPECGGKMVIRLGRFGKFLSCVKFPECKGMKPMGDAPELDEEFWKKYAEVKKCPACGGPMTLKTGRFGKFWACEKYPECKSTMPLILKAKCPECGKPLVERKSKKGRPFTGCSGYPDCKYIVKYVRKGKRPKRE